MFTKEGTSFLNFDSSVPVIVWFQGGPGGASEFGSFSEFGPFKINKDNAGNLKVMRRLTAQNKKYHLMFVDNPLNVGFSYAQRDGKEYHVKTTEEAATHVVNFF